MSCISRASPEDRFEGRSARIKQPDRGRSDRFRTWLVVVLHACARILKRSTVNILFWTGVLPAYAAVKLRHRGVALMYHRVLPADRASSSCSASAIQVTPESFARHLRFLGRYFRPIAASRLAQLLAKGRSLPSRTVLITFDDGWHDNLLHALPILVTHEVPAVIFVATDHVGRNGGFWQERLTRLLLLAYREGLLQRGDLRSLGFQLPDGLGERALRLAIRSLVDNVKKQQGIDTTDLLAQVRSALSTAASPDELAEFGEDRFLAWDELASLRDTGFVELGSHACSHRPLVDLTDNQLTDELNRSRALLEGKLGQPVRCFAYPNGDFNAHVSARVRSAGYDLAFTTRYGLLGNGHHLHSLGRVSVHQAAADTCPMLLARIVGLI